MGTIRRQSEKTPGALWRYPEVPVTEYRDGDSTGVTRQVMVGKDEGAADFIVRYFVLPAGSRSAFHRHPHDHGVVIVQGSGRVLLGDQWHEVGVGDAVHTGKDEQHQFHASGSTPLAFVCVIPSWAEADACVVK